MEVVVALGVVLFVLISIVALVLINSFGQKGSENRTIALNLAREGIEVFRNMRDTAKLQKSGIPNFSSESHYYYLVFSASTNSWTINTSDVSWTNTRLYLIPYNPLGVPPTFPIYVPTVASNVYTNFQRRITVDSICSDVTKCSIGTAGVCEASETDNCVVANVSNYVGYRIKSEVQWLENNQTVNLELVDFLYDWR